MYYPCSKNKGADQAVDAQLICGFVFAYASCWFSHVVAHFDPDAYILEIPNREVEEESNISGINIFTPILASRKSEIFLCFLGLSYRKGLALSERSVDEALLVPPLDISVCASELENDG